MAILYIFIINQISKPDSGDLRLDSVYYRYRVSYEDTLPIDSQFTLVQYGKREETPNGLKISGVKDFSFDMNQGFDQGLKVDITGEVEGIKIEGNLSDKATPLQTVSISDVDKMSLKVSTKNFYGGIGNLSLDLPFGITDEIQGGRLSFYNLNKENSFNLSYAINRGSYKRIEFNGEEGKQGPYMLTGGVITGSEKVYLSKGIGLPVLLQRDQDYIMDYEQGILSFTNKNIIASRTRITIEYQEATQDYPNIYQEVDGGVKGGNFTTNILYRRGYDEKNNPLNFTLTPTEIESLKCSGDSLKVHHIYADTSSQGSYDLVGDNFVYMGEGKGRYNVTFFYVGENNGEYIYDPIIKGFSYIGVDHGNYSPRRSILLPRDDQFYAMGIDVFNSVGFVVFGSNLDKNTFSSLNDDDNLGKGYQINFDKIVGVFSMKGTYLNYDENLHLPMARGDVDYHYLWNTSDPLNELANINVGIKPIQDLNFEVMYGVMNREQKRRRIAIRPLFFQFGYEDVDTINRYFCGFVRGLDKWTFNSRYEKVENLHYLNYGVQYSLKKKNRIGITGDYEKDIFNRGITTKFDILFVPVNFSFGHRTYNDTTFLFGDAVFNFSYKSVSLMGSLQQSQCYAQKRDEVYVKVKEGTGNYIYDPITNSYIEKEGGNYIKRSVLLREFEKMVARNYNIETDYSKRIFNVKGRFSYSDEKSFYSHNEEVLLSLDADNYGIELDMNQSISDDKRYALESSFKQERVATLNPSYRELSGRVEYREETEKSGDFLRRDRNDYNGELSYEVFKNPSIRPYLGYTYSKIFSAYFENLDIRLNAPRTRLVIGKPLNRKGRVELDGELIYRIYNIEDVPYFYRAIEPPGLTKLLGTTVGIGVGENTIFSFVYRIQFPPEENFIQSLRFQVKIKF